MPRSDSEVDVNTPFAASELLFRRAFPSEINSKGELVPTQLESFSFSREVEGAPSFLRGAYAEPKDVVHQDCAGRSDVSSCSVFQLMVSELPDPCERETESNIHFGQFTSHFQIVGLIALLGAIFMEIKGESTQSPRTRSLPNYA